MDIGIGTTTVDRRNIVKDYTEVTRLNGVRLGQNSTSVINPVFIFNMVQDKSNPIDIDFFSDINYVHWFKMHRFYYCEIVFNGTLVEIHCTLDPRRTWMDTIRNSRQYVTRQEKKWNKQLFDSEIPLESKKVVNIYKFPNKVGDSTETSRNYILITNGKVEVDS